MKNVFTNEKVTIEEQEILLSESLKFTGCEVLFKNCTFNAGGEVLSIFLNSCSRVLVSGCTFLDFSAPVFVERENGPMVIWDSIFKNCMATNIKLKGSETYYGGVIRTEKIKENATKLIMDTAFIQCGYPSYKDGIIANGYCEVYNCKYDYYGKGIKTAPDVKKTHFDKKNSFSFLTMPLKTMSTLTESFCTPDLTLFRYETKGRGNEVISEREETKVFFGTASFGTNENEGHGLFGFNNKESGE